MELNKTYKFPPIFISFLYAKLTLLLLLISTPFLFLGLNGWFVIVICLFIFLGLPFALYFALDYNNTSFSVEENKITLNWGIISKKSKTIVFDSIQNVTIISGLLARIFGIFVLRIWTASPGQIHKDSPDGVLYLAALDAGWLKNFMTANRLKQ
ncbi:MAG: PH domain-containing protein [Patescibacteria group bacterium]|nr:PH domain-containing protein [Patescibacteria group bacterium]MDD5121733.1 PH domain-containing protein [Patescibacteria group bacterium]MDD5221965.1 PH domain-containing protein [Patescibacteria group bacterium]MDD5396102.1 PH domain-containing protein [Patescibacteria group bacterium]